MSPPDNNFSENINKYKKIKRNNETATVTEVNGNIEKNSINLDESGLTQDVKMGIDEIQKKRKIEVITMPENNCNHILNEYLKLKNEGSIKKMQKFKELNVSNDTIDYIDKNITTLHVEKSTLKLKTISQFKNTSPKVEQFFRAINNFTYRDLEDEDDYLNENIKQLEEEIVLKKEKRKMIKLCMQKYKLISLKNEINQYLQLNNIFSP